MPATETHDRPPQPFAEGDIVLRIGYPCGLFESMEVVWNEEKGEWQTGLPYPMSEPCVGIRKATADDVQFAIRASETAITKELKRIQQLARWLERIEGTP